MARQSDDPKSLQNIGKRGIASKQGQGEDNDVHPQGSPVPGAHGGEEHISSHGPHTPNIDKALHPDKD